MERNKCDKELINENSQLRGELWEISSVQAPHWSTTIMKKSRKQDIKEATYLSKSLPRPSEHEVVPFHKRKKNAHQTLIDTTHTSIIPIKPLILQVVHGITTTLFTKVVLKEEASMGFVIPQIHHVQYDRWSIRTLVACLIDDDPHTRERLVAFQIPFLKLMYSN